MGAWPRLQTWAREEEESAACYRRLAHAAWLHERGEGPLLRNPELSAVAAWRAKQQPTAAWAERYGGGYHGAMRFLAASEEAAREPGRRPPEPIPIVVPGPAHTVATSRRRNAWPLLFGLGLLLVLLATLLAFLAAFQSENARRGAEASSRSAFSAYLLAKAENERAQRAELAAREQSSKARSWALEAKLAARDAARDEQEIDDHLARVVPGPGPSSPSNTGAPSPRPTPARTHAPAPRPAESPASGPSNRNGYIPNAPDPGRGDNEACRRALIFERTAATDWVARQTSYSAANSGLAINEHCNEPRRDVNEAYLLAMRAAAAFALNTGNWKADLDRSDALLARCAERPEYRAAWVGADCRTQLRFNAQIRGAIERQIAARRK